MRRGVWLKMNEMLEEKVRVKKLLEVVATKEEN